MYTYTCSKRESARERGRPVYIHTLTHRARRERERAGEYWHLRPASTTEPVEPSTVSVTVTRMTGCWSRCFRSANTSAYVSIRQHTSAYVSIPAVGLGASAEATRQHTSAYVSIRQHTSAYVSMR